MTTEHGLTPEELAMLTPAERAGLEAEDDGDDEENPGDEEHPEQQAGDAGDEDEGGENADKPKPADADKPVEQQPAAQQEDQPQPEQTKTAQPVPLFKADVPEDIEAKFKDIDTREEALIEKFEDGDLTTREYNAQLRQLNKERGDLEWTQRKAELAQEGTQSQREQAWYDTVNAFLPDHPLIEKNETLWNTFNAVLQRVTGEVQAAGGWPGRAELERAYKQFTDDLGIEAQAAAGDKPEEQQPGKQPNARQAPKPNVPPTLAAVPAAAHENTDDGKFAHLDRLTGDEYEEAVAKLSPAEWDDYANSR